MFSAPYKIPIMYQANGDAAGWPCLGEGEILWISHKTLQKKNFKN